jgi:RNase P subunit RPR2
MIGVCKYCQDKGRMEVVEVKDEGRRAVLICKCCGWTTVAVIERTVNAEDKIENKAENPFKGI